jgi:hypothetical protein
MENKTITAEEIEYLNIIFEMLIKTDEDYQKLAKITDEDE